MVVRPSRIVKSQLVWTAILGSAAIGAVGVIRANRNKASKDCVDRSTRDEGMLASEMHL